MIKALNCWKYLSLEKSWMYFNSIGIYICILKPRIYTDIHGCTKLISACIEYNVFVRLFPKAAEPHLIGGKLYT